MKTDLNNLVGKRVNVEYIKNEYSQADRYIKNGIVDRITERGQVVVFCDEKSENSILLFGGYFYPDAYKIEVVGK